MENSTLELIREFVNQRPCLEFANYGDVKSYRSESREITNDLHDFREIMSLAFTIVPNLEERLTEYLTKSSDRLTLVNGKLQYITGQYFPTEYRPAVNRVLSNIMWRYVVSEYFKGELGKETTGDDIRKWFRKRLSRRVCKYYFN